MKRYVMYIDGKKSNEITGFSELKKLFKAIKKSGYEYNSYYISDSTAERTFFKNTVSDFSKLIIVEVK